MNSETIDATLAAVGHKTAQIGAGTSFVAFLLSSQGAAVVGIVGVVGGLAIQFYFRRRQDRREMAEHELRMQLVASGHEARMELERARE